MLKKNYAKNIAQDVLLLAEPIAANLGLDIWDVKFLKEGPNYYLRIFIDSEKGVTIDDCEKMSRALDKPLDELDPISQNYCLEVCSPGVNRELENDKHLKKYLGQKIIIKLFNPLPDGNKKLNATLLSFNEKEIVVSCKNNFKNLCILRKNVASIKLDDLF